MNRCITIIGVATLAAGVLSADDYARVEGFLGYNYVHFYSQNGVPSFSANGGSGQFTYNFNRWIGGVLDAGAVTNNNFAGFSINNTQAFFMAGPRLSIRNSRFKPYIQGVFGGVYYTASTQIDGTLMGRRWEFPFRLLRSAST